MRFVYPWMLTAIPILIILSVVGFYLLRRQNKSLGLFATNDLLRRLGLVSGKDGKEVGVIAKMQYLQLVLLSLSLLLMVAGAARPQWGKKEQNVKTNSRSLLIALDVSRSMLAKDVHPNRLERAKVDILDLITDLKGDRAGILTFRGKGAMLCPLTTDYAFLRQAVNAISVDSAPRGETDLGDAITKCLSALASYESDNAAILLISDGEDLAGRALKAAEEAKKRQIPIFTVGIGGTSGSHIPNEDGNGMLKFGGKEVQSRLVEKSLKEIAAASGGVYVPLATSGTATTTLGSIYRSHLSKIASKEFEESLEKRFCERYQLFLFPAIILLLAAASLSKGRLARAKRFAVFAVMVLCLGSASGATREEKIAYNEALKSFKGGDVTNTSQILLPFAGRRDFKEAVELYGASELKKAQDELIKTNTVKRIELLSNAAKAFQGSALLSEESDDERERNLFRALSDLPLLREEAQKEDAFSKYKGMALDALFVKLHGEARSIMEDAKAISTNVAALRIDGMEKLAGRQRELMKIWYPIREFVAQDKSITNEADRAQILESFNETQRMMSSSIDSLENINSDSALENLEQLENSAFGFMVLGADPRHLIDENIMAVANVVTNPHVPITPARDDSETALGLTRFFMERFPKWAEEYIQKEAQTAAQTGSTNAPSFTEDDARKIVSLTESLEWFERDNCNISNKLERVSGAKDALKILEQIRELLPKENNNQNSEQKQGENEDKNESEQKQEENQSQEERKEQEENSPEEPKEPPKDVEETLRRALEREQEHEKEKEKGRRVFPISPNVRDW